MLAAQNLDLSAQQRSFAQYLLDAEKSALLINQANVDHQAEQMDKEKAIDVLILILRSIAGDAVFIDLDQLNEMASDPSRDKQAQAATKWLTQKNIEEQNDIINQVNASNFQGPESASEILNNHFNRFSQGDNNISLADLEKATQDENLTAAQRLAWAWRSGDGL